MTWLAWQVSLGGQPRCGPPARGLRMRPRQLTQAPALSGRSVVGDPEVDTTAQGVGGDT